MTVDELNKCGVCCYAQLLHRGSLCNRLLPVVERGFKHVSIEVKIAAFDAWQALIDNYALNPG